MRASSICLDIEDIIGAVKLLLEEEVAEHLSGGK